MSRTHHHGKHGSPTCEEATKNRASGYEYWSRRPLSSYGGISPGKWAKTMTHRLERRKKIEYE